MLMRNESFFCNGCHRVFKLPEFYDEKHGLDNPPFERVAVCPVCRCDDFLKFDTAIEKYDVVEKILPVAMHLNKYIGALRDIWGDGIKNDDLFCGVEMIAEMVSEMFDFFEVDMQRKILKMDNDRELQEILMYLRGGV